MSEQGLREAVDDLRAWCDMQREAAGHEESEYAAGEFLAYKRVRGHLLRILAAHPAESASRPVIDREAVAQRLLYEEGSEWAENTNRHYELADAVMELARPVPTREQIAEALRGVELSGDQITDAYVTADEADTLAGAVLALLTGSES